MPFFQALRGLISGNVFRPCRACRVQFEKIEAENSRFTAENGRLIAENSRLVSENSNLVAEVAALKTTASTAVDIGSVTEALRATQSDSSGKSEKIKLLSTSNLTLGIKYRQRENTISKLERELTHTKQEREELKTSVRQYKDLHASKEEENQSLILERDNARVAEAAAIEEAMKATEEKDRALQREREAVVGAITARNQMWGEYHDAQQTIEDLRRQNQELQATNLSAQSTDPPASIIVPPSPEVNIVDAPPLPAMEASQPPSRAISPEIAPPPNLAIERDLDNLVASLTKFTIGSDDGQEDTLMASMARLSIESPSSSITSVRGAGHQGYCTSFTSGEYTQPSSPGSTDGSSGFMQQPSSSVSTAPPSSSGSTDASDPASSPEGDSTMDGMGESDAAGALEGKMGAVPGVADASDAGDCEMSGVHGMTDTPEPADSEMADTATANDDQEMEDSPEDGPQTGCKSTTQESSAMPTGSLEGEPTQTRSPFAPVLPTNPYAIPNHLNPSSTPAYMHVGPRNPGPSRSPFTLGAPSQGAPQRTGRASGPSTSTGVAPLYNPFNRHPSSSARPSTMTAASPSQAPGYMPGMTPVPFSLRASKTPGAVFAPSLESPSTTILYIPTPAPASTPPSNPTPSSGATSPAVPAVAPDPEEVGRRRREESEESEEP